MQMLVLMLKECLRRAERVGQHLGHCVRRALTLDSPIAKAQNVVRLLAHHADVVGDEQDGHSTFFIQP